MPDDGPVELSLDGLCGELGRMLISGRQLAFSGFPGTGAEPVGSLAHPLESLPFRDQTAAGGVCVHGAC